MRRVFSALCAAATGAFALAASDAEAVPIRYDCDTAAGVYSMINFAQAGPDYRITGRVSGLKFRSHNEWFPVAGVRLLSSDRKTIVGVRLQRERSRGPIQAILQTYSEGQQQDTPLGVLRPSEQVPFQIEASGVSVRVNMAGRSVDVGSIIGPNAQVEISCSTGQFMFEDLDWDAPAAMAEQP